MGDLAIKRTRNAVDQTADHAVWIPKYRRRVLVGEIVDRLRGVPHEVCQAKGFEVLALESQPDQWFNGSLARTLFAEFPALRVKLRRGHLWAPSFSIGTAGQVSAETIRRYIERTEHIETRR